MSGSSKESIEVLKTYFGRLMDRCSQLEARCATLEKENKTLQEDLSKERAEKTQLSNRLVKCEAQYEKLQMSQLAALSVTQTRENKERFAKLVREIDKCISLLQE